MPAFEMLDIAGTGLTMHQSWLDMLSFNIANVNTVRSTDQPAFQAQYAMAEAVEGGGVRVSGIAVGDPTGRVVYKPEHPLADENGYVRMPDIDLSAQMSQLIMAQRGFQAQTSVIRNAEDIYSAALSIGRNA
jgi:flagellar basal-body rod protein FlgC